MTPALADLGRRIDECMRKHGFSARELFNRHVARQIAATGTARAALTITLNDDGTVSCSEWRSA